MDLTPAGGKFESFWEDGSEGSEREEVANMVFIVCLLLQSVTERGFLFQLYTGGGWTETDEVHTVA